MHQKATLVLSFGFLMGLGLASCATESVDREDDIDRAPASLRGMRRTRVKEEKDDKPKDCMVGESRNEDGDCVRPHTFDRPFRRGGR